MDRFDRALRAFDELNAADPVSELVNGVARPRLLVQAERLSHWIGKLDPNAPEALRLAARCQHVERWKIARSEFPEGRAGYLKWRTALARFHAERAENVLRDVGYDDETIARLSRIVKKQNLQSNPDAQTMEDALCLVFLEFELDAFLTKYPDREKALDILRKTWRKMSERGRAAALTLPAGSRARELLEQALGSG